MKKKCESCPYFLDYQKLDDKIRELEFWQKHALNALKEKETHAKESAKDIADINRELERILCAFKLIYREELEEIKRKTNPSSVGVK